MNYPNSIFKPGDILTQSDKIPEGSIGKYINDTIGWAWVFNPLEFPEIFEPMWKEFIKESGYEFPTKQ